MLQCIAFLASASFTPSVDTTYDQSYEMYSAFQVITNWRIPERELIQAIKSLNPTLSYPHIWRKVANSPQYSVIHRRHCIFQLVKRHIRSGCTLGTVAGVLGNPAWLKEGDVTVVETVFGHIPVKMRSGETVLLLQVLPDKSPCWGVYLRVSGRITVADFLNLLRRKEVANTVKKSRVLQVGFVPGLSPPYKEQER